MKLIIGLGNPGAEYEHTRHNAGFLFLDFLKDEWNCEAFKEENRFQAELAAGIFNGEKIMLAKPLTFMNESGRAVREILQFFKIEQKDLIIVHDELDVALGKYKVATDSRAAGHNGVQNIIDTLGTQAFTRIRIGISRPAPLENGTCISLHDYVLQRFSEEEEKTLRDLFPALRDQTEKLLQP